MIESKLTFLQMQVEGAFMNPPESEQPHFGNPPEALNPIDMDSAPDKFIPPMIDPEMLAIPHIDQPIISAPPIRVDHTVQCDLPANNRLQRGFPAVRDELGVDLPMALENAKDDRFPVRPATSFPLNATRPKVGFIHFDLATERRLRFTEFGNPLAKNSHISVDRVAIQPSQRGHL